MNAVFYFFIILKTCDKTFRERVILYIAKADITVIFLFSIPLIQLIKALTFPVAR